MITISRFPDGSHSADKDLPDPRWAMEKPIPVEVREMPEPFNVRTIEGRMDGKAGDFLITGIRGEMYPCDREIFLESYDFVDK